MRGAVGGRNASASATHLTGNLSFLVESLSRAGIGDALAAEESRFDQNMSLHPYFDFDVVRNVTARVGQTAFLNCRVEQLGDKSVIQLRSRTSKRPPPIQFLSTLCAALNVSKCYISILTNTRGERECARIFVIPLLPHSPPPIHGAPGHVQILT